MNLIKNGAVGTRDVADCEFQSDYFIDKKTKDKNEAYENMALGLHDLIMSGSHPLVNPFFDKFLEYETNDIKEAFKIFVKKNSSYKTEECTQDQDVLSLYINMELIAINLLPIVEKEDGKIKLNKMSIQTPLFRYDIEE